MVSKYVEVNMYKDQNYRDKMAKEATSFQVTFLGTCSGGGPTETRNCSSLVLDMLRDLELWMVDCAEGTVRQFASQPNVQGQSLLRINRVAKIFITHMHADHIMGVITLLRNLLYRTKVPLYPGEVITKPAVQLFGPAGLRTFVRQNLKYTLTRAADRYCVHELLTAHDPITPCDPIPDGSTSFHSAEANIMHNSELPGLDIRAGPDGLWRALTEGPGRMSKILVDAGPILHRDPCIGYVFQEAWYPSRKVVILGDTHNPEAMIPLCSNPAPTLLVHEATDSHISPSADAEGKLSKRSAETVLQTALSLGHSTPEMAGAFAKRVGAQMLVLNHIGARFPAPRHHGDHNRKRIMRDILKKANTVWGPKKVAVAATDFMRVDVPIDPSLQDTKNQPSTRTEVGMVNANEPKPPAENEGASGFSAYRFYDSEQIEYINPNAIASTSSSQAGAHDVDRSAFVAYDPAGQNRKKRKRRH